MWALFGSEHSMILIEDGKILTFGRNNFGQLGTGEPLLHQIPQKLPNLKVKDVIIHFNYETTYVDPTSLIKMVPFGQSE